MHLHRLEVEGFGPFRARQTVDFDAFADDGIFLIAGRTGAGKSSILDAVCFGLYGGVPRYDSGDKRLRSDHSELDEPTQVVVDFSTVSGRYRVTRAPAYERPAKRGGGTTTQQASALLEKLVDDEWVGLAARSVDVANELNEILQLTQEQFLQVILLAQNRFADFLLADSRERQALLRRLFGTERFSDYQARFDERRRAAEQALSGRRAKVDARLDEAERLVTDAALWGDDAEDGSGDPGADGSPESSGARGDAPPSTSLRIELLRRAVTRADYRVEQRGIERGGAEKTLTVADAALSALKEQRQAQLDRDRAREALAQLDARADEIARARRRRDHARSAEVLRTVITTAARTATAAEKAADAESRAVARALALAVPEAAPTAGSPSEHFRTWASDRTRASGAWQRAVELETESALRSAQLSDAQATVAATSDAVASIDVERVALPAKIAETTASRDQARRTGDRAGTATHDVTAAEQRAAGAREVERLTAVIDDAQRAESAATEVHSRAQAALAELRRRRLDGYAGELASALVDGEPCAVCGSTSHPAPAEHADPVSADDIAAAEDTRDAAAAAEKKASAQLSEHNAALAAARERAGGCTVEAADEQLAAAREALDVATSAAQRAAKLTAELETLQQQNADVEVRRTAASEALASARTQLSLIEQRIADAEATIADARGDYPSVAERLAEAQKQIAAATAAADAIDANLDAEDRANLARHECDQAIAESDFDDVTAAEQALLPAVEIAALDERINDHAAETKKERALLLDLELRMLPDEPIDLAPAQAAAADARAAWQTAVDADSRARSLQKSLSSTLDAAVSEHAESADDAAAFEVIRGLADTLAGRSGNTHKMNLETFVLAAELEEIVAAANLRLHDMSDGRYQLRHSDALASHGKSSGLGIVVFDAFTGQTRPAKSLSGGETFLSSLALALGLAEVVTARAGGIRLDTLFIDEGFGSLDADTLETAMRTLDELRQGGRTVGVISHVEAMQEQIPAQLTVRALPDGPSVIDAPRG